MVKIRNGIRMEQGFSLQLSNFIRLSSYIILVMVMLISSRVLCRQCVQKQMNNLVMIIEVLKNSIMVQRLLIRLLISLLKLMIWMLILLFFIECSCFFNCWENLLQFNGLLVCGLMLSSGVMIMLEWVLLVIRLFMILVCDMLWCKVLIDVWLLLQLVGIMVLLLMFFLVIFFQCMMGIYSECIQEWLILGIRQSLLFIFCRVCRYFGLQILFCLFDIIM